MARHRDGSLSEHPREDGLTALERRVSQRVAERETELVELLRSLINFNTITHSDGAPARQEAELQQLLAARLERCGAQATLFEPDRTALGDRLIVPERFSFAGRPQLVARFAGAGGGRTLLLNGHIDVVDAEPYAAWSSDPFVASIHGGAVWGRGACDMKGGVACMVIAAEVLAELDAPLAGDLVVNTVTDEESTGAGGLAAARMLKADAAIVPEPSSLQVAVACRGSLLLALTVEGRPGHAGTPPGDPALGGAVNAVEKTAYMIEALRRLREEWALRPPHPYLAAADCVPTVISGGEWIVSYPGRCRLECHLEYLPTPEGGDPAPRVRREVEEWIARAAAADTWLREHPPAVEWLAGSVPPAQVSPDEPIVQTLIGVERAAGRAGRISGFDNWHDGAWLILEAGIPTVCFGPRGLSVAHTVDEHVPIADLVSCAQAIALSALRFCGVANASPV
ncbi:MAG: ArgE/DapE family deacylase [Solirubrobacterales bacterium]|nr:ArgE/DapE family deacylase [Solirubrobacterales bacterium]